MTKLDFPDYRAWSHILCTQNVKVCLRTVFDWGQGLRADGGQGPSVTGCIIGLLLGPRQRNIELNDEVPLTPRGVPVDDDLSCVDDRS